MKLPYKLIQWIYLINVWICLANWLVEFPLDLIGWDWGGAKKSESEFFASEQNYWVPFPPSPVFMASAHGVILRLDSRDCGGLDIR